MTEIINTMKKFFQEGNASPDSAEEFFYFVFLIIPRLVLSLLLSLIPKGTITPYAQYKYIR